jgi:hypothetical protein
MWRPFRLFVLLLFLTIILAVVAWWTSLWRFAQTEVPEPVVVFDLVQPLPDKSGERPENPLFVNFKCNLMPLVGEQITVEGVLRGAKLGASIPYNGWQIYIRNTSEADFARQVVLDRSFDGHVIRATGTLRYFSPEPLTGPNGWKEQSMPEHFYFAAGEVVVTDLDASPAK